MELRTRINSAMKEAMKNKDQVALSTVRLISAALKDRDITAKANGQMDGINEGDILSMMKTMIKQRQDSAKTYRDADRPELAEREEQEIKVIEQFLPVQLSEKEVSNAIDTAIEETGASDVKDMGKVIGMMKSKYAGQIDMGIVSGMVKQKLG